MTAKLTRFDDVTVQFVDHPPLEEVVYYARRCAKERWLHGPLTVVVTSSGGSTAGNYGHRIEIRGPGHTNVSECGDDVLLALRDAFDRFELTGVLEPPH